MHLPRPLARRWALRPLVTVLLVAVALLVSQQAVHTSQALHDAAGQSGVVSAPSTDTGAKLPAPTCDVEGNAHLGPSVAGSVTTNATATPAVTGGEDSAGSTACGPADARGPHVVDVRGATGVLRV